MILTISWKNIWRKKVRSIIILLAISLGITAGIFNMGFYYGMIDQRIESAVNSEASHIQIHDTAYLSNPGIKIYFEKAGRIKQEIENRPTVKAVSNRLIMSSMALTAESAVGVRINGINPDDEREVSNIHRKLVAGTYFDESMKHPIVIGEELADKLDVGLKNKIILHVQTVDGTMTRNRYKVAGVFRTSNAQYDERNVFVRKEELGKIVQLPGHAAHEIAILLHKNDDVDPVYHKLAKEYPQLSVKPWYEILPEVGLIEESMDITMYFIMLIILLALCFSIINTMLMAVLERIKEIGMLKAIGMNRFRIFSMVMIETVLIAITGGLVGLGLGYLSILITGSTGIDLSIYSEAWEELGYDSIIYPTISMVNLGVVTLLVVFTGILASVYPALKAVRLNPAEALKVDL